MFSLMARAAKVLSTNRFMFGWNYEQNIPDCT